MGKLAKTIFVILISFTLCACKSPQANEPNDQRNVKQLSSIEQDMSQSIAEQIKEWVANHKNVTKVYAVNTYDSLVVAFELKPLARFRTHKISKQFKEQIGQKYPMFEAIVSTDQKIVWELKKIEQKVKNGDLSVNELQLEVKRLIKLSKDNA